jgi:hypothetical protein
MKSTDLTKLRQLRQPVGWALPTDHNKRSKKTLNCYIDYLRYATRTSNFFNNQSILTTPNIHITNSIMVCGQCPPYRIFDVISITSGTLRERTIASTIVGEACYRQSILIIPNIHITKSIMIFGQCPPYGIFDVILPSLNLLNSLPLG